MKSWKSQWKAELKESTPKLRADILHEQKNVSRSSSCRTSQTPIVKRKPFLYGMSATIAVALIAIVLCATLIPSGNVDVCAFVVEINPAVTISTDNNGNVTGIVASNDDADVILSDTDAVNKLYGKSISEVVKWYVDKAVMLGYLDTANTSAVRISTVTNGNKMLKSVCDDLENYFMEKGILSFVVSDIVDLKEFAERAHLHAEESINDLTKRIQDLEPLSRNRGVELLDKEELQQTYKKYVASGSLVSGIGDYLNGLIDTIEQNERDIADLLDLSESIEKHDENPASMLKDYWSVKTFYKEYESDFGALMAQMDEALEKYNAVYGMDITAKSELISVSAMYRIISAKNLREILKNFSAEFLQQHLDWLSDIIQTVTSDAPLIGLTSLPDTASDFIVKVRDIITIERASREKQFQDIYNQVRGQISQADYSEFKNGLLDEYGTLDNLWQNLK